jgi:hypothetical protein
MKNEMRNRMLNNFIQDLGGFLYWLLKQLLMLAMVGLVAILYYQAGKAQIFENMGNIDEVCEQREKDLTQPIDEVSPETMKENKGAANEEK